MPKIIHEFKRIKTSTADQKKLKDEGFTPFFSSNVSAGDRRGSDLFIRFHNGSIYKYPNQGKNFGDLLLSSSKGKWVWQNLRNRNVAFSKVGSLPLNGDRDLTDDELFNEIQNLKVSVQKPIITSLLSTVVPTENVSFLTTLVSRQELLTVGIIASNMASLL